MIKKLEALWWLLFSAGGMFVALFVPIQLIVDQSFVLFNDQGLILYENVWVRLYLALLVSLGSFHCVHRLRHTLVDLGLQNFETLIGVVSYAVAVLMSILAISYI